MLIHLMRRSYKLIVLDSNSDLAEELEKMGENLLLKITIGKIHTETGKNIA